MARRTAAAPFITVTLDPQGTVPLHRQLYSALRQAILNGQLTAGRRLPPTRVLAQELSISRTTVLSAFEQLLAEGYLEARTGSGTYVARELPETLLQAPAQPLRRKRPGLSRRSPSRRGLLLASTPVTLPRESLAPATRAFNVGQPALEEIPFAIWERLARRYYRQPPQELLWYGDPAGYRPLREAIAAYLNTSRALQCSPDQVLITSGAQQGIDLAARVLLDPGDAVWVEDPGYLGARGTLTAQGARLVPVPVDAEGLNIAAGRERCLYARMAYITPSHQYPLGVVMSLKRRLELLEWARRSDAWLLEDDYDSEYRYHGRPLAALQGLDQHGQVIYVGTFSKVLFPALRLGYLVVPPDLVGAFVSARALSDRHAALLEQAVLADFIAEGHFTRHIRRMRALYAQRQQALIEALKQELAGLIEVVPHEAGMHLVAWLPPQSNDREISRRAARLGVEALALSSFALAHRQRPGLLLGYACTNEDQIRAGVRLLARAISE